MSSYRLIGFFSVKSKSIFFKCFVLFFKGGRGGQKKQPQPKKTVTTRSSSAESRSSESANDTPVDTKSSKKKLTTAESKILAHKSIFSDSDSESGNKRPRSPPFRTKAAMKEFSVADLPRGAGSKHSQKQTPPASAASKKKTSPGKFFQKFQSCILKIS